MENGKKLKSEIGKTKMEKSSRILLFLSLFLIFSNSINAQERDSSIVLNVIKHGLIDTKELYLSPLRWDKKDWVIAGGVTAATTALILWGDQPIYDFTNTIHTNSRDIFFRNAEPLGNYYPIMALSAFMIKGLVYREDYSIETSLIAAEAILLSTLTVQVVKNTVGRSRPNPYGTTTPHDFKGPFFKGNSFYSGHTTEAFSVASVFAYRYRDTKWVPVLAYGLATIAGLERIYDNRHWASDVLMGAATGTATGLLLCKQWEKNSIKFFPTISTQGGGISMLIPIK